MEEMPSLQTCKSEGIILQTKGILSLHFALDTLPKLDTSTLDKENYTLFPEEIAEAAERFSRLTAETSWTFSTFGALSSALKNILFYLTATFPAATIECAFCTDIAGDLTSFSTFNDAWVVTVCIV